MTLLPCLVICYWTVSLSGKIIMLKEARNVPQIVGDPRRRWFWNNYLDLVVWFDDSDEIIGFQLYYDRHGDQTALTWKEPFGYSQDNFEVREDAMGMYKAGCFAGFTEVFEKEKIADVLRKESCAVDKRIVDFVHKKIMSYSI